MPIQIIFSSPFAHDELLNLYNIITWAHESWNLHSQSFFMAL